MLNKYLHFTTGLLFAFVASTAFLVITQFSKEDLIYVLEICANQTGTEVMPSDLLKTAKIIRHKIWDLHIVGGFILVISYLIFILRSKTTIYKQSKKIKLFYKSITILLILLLTTGLLHLQTFSIFMLQFKQFFTDIHFYLAFVITGIVLIHIIDKIKNSKTEAWD